MNLLEVRNLSKRFGGLLAVADFNLDLPEGALYGLIGPNGAGKTTVFNLITGVYPPTAGSVKLAGRELVGLPAHRITQRGVARTFQNIRLFGGMTVLDNIKVAFNYRTGYHLWGAVLHGPGFNAREQAITEQAYELLRLFRLESRYDQLAKSLPYGEQRRLEIARALATNPRLLLLDEPAAGMNPREVGELVELIRWVREKFQLTVFLIEHQMRLVMNLCERIQVMDFGETIAEGTPAEIVDNRRVIEAYLGEEEGA
ncbi:MAG: ABC transporter ATP-binding protein [Bacillota bacterium]|nr:ABC transporter ATP-binding protein [Bacillota bacterium]